MVKNMRSILVLRLLALGVTISATVVTPTTHDSRHVLNLTFKASYSNAPTLRYFVVANAIASGYSIIVLLIPSKNFLWKFILISDLVTRSVDTERGQLSPQEHRTVEAIAKTSELPLSIILVGVRDGPWDMMKDFDDNIPARAFDDFQFVNFTKIMSKKLSTSRKETEFAQSSLMEIPSQYKATMELHLLGRARGNVPDRYPLPPPSYRASSFSSSKPSHSTSYKTSSPYNSYSSPASTAPPIANSTYDNLVCPICLSNSKNMAFGCEHQTCCECGEDRQL